MGDGKIKEQLHDVMREAKNAARSLDHLMHGVVMILVLIGLLFLLVSAISTGLLIAITMTVVFSVSLAVFVSTQSFGEGALALIFGLVGIFSVDWTTGGLIAFNFAWVAFAGLAFIISAIRSNADLQIIYGDIAQRLSDSRQEAASKEKEITALADSLKIGLLGYEGVAETFRLMAYRGVKEALFSPVVLETERLVKLTRTDHEKLSSFLVDLIKRLDVQTVGEFEKVAEEVRDILRGVKATPGEFFAAYEASRAILLRREVRHDEFFRALGQAIDEGVPPEQAHAAVMEKMR
ncbi:hypothetical protein Tgr7_2613 [Thioalkalivibrio sulfidiphilus HL-EbGr7]|uniref:Uncharacterized protein n=1 Tax=Thioalkalivibrio sulfidiphilus (strain HL-EbGR7) TaxID=396588 RepID=B8GMA1_THISH|nr:hypothetical protein [Thioalkalivibrio sulfidiphilus]ACL73688.1 hypothetical protein Tgr7_2613 [Thioalkalivibrio sulfidiphilus HL-EbGr7]